MKLIDLLVQELPNRGGWPHSVDDIEMFANGDIYFDGYEAPELFKLPQCSDGWRPGCDDLHGNSVTKEQYETALAASRHPIWNGEGLPPVGCECEWQDRNTKHWAKVSIVYASEWVTVIREDKIADPVEIAIENYGDEERKKFRPVRTEAERKRKSTIDDITETIIYFYGNPKGAECYKPLAERIFDAINIGKIPGIRLE